MIQNQPEKIKTINEAKRVRKEIINLLENDEEGNVEALIENIAKIHKSNSLSEVRKELFTVYTEMMIYYIIKGNSEKLEYYLKKIDSTQTRYPNDRLELMIFQQLVRAYEVIKDKENDENSVGLVKYMMKLAKRAPYEEVARLFCDFCDRKFVFRGPSSYRDKTRIQKIRGLMCDSINNHIVKSIKQEFFPMRMFLDILVKKFGAIITKSDGEIVDFILPLSGTSSVKHDFLGPTIVTRRVPGYKDYDLNSHITIVGVEYFAKDLGIEKLELIKYFDEYGIVFPIKGIE
ncbi:MAG: hypothetical protein GOP50_07410 [Candidatus Heimdallarchaeota archaeon]|nr:hypothetical protein [Candidatus Heimdallarchaeota archaeon]